MKEKYTSTLVLFDHITFYTLGLETLKTKIKYIFEYLQGANIQTFKRIKKIFYVLNYHFFSSFRTKQEA